MIHVPRTNDYMRDIVLYSQTVFINVPVVSTSRQAACPAMLPTGLWPRSRHVCWYRQYQPQASTRSADISVGWCLQDLRERLFDTAQKQSGLALAIVAGCSGTFTDRAR